MARDRRRLLAQRLPRPLRPPWANGDRRSRRRQRDRHRRLHIRRVGLARLEISQGGELSTYAHEIEEERQLFEQWFHLRANTAITIAVTVCVGSFRHQSRACDTKPEFASSIFEPRRSRLQVAAVVRIETGLEYQSAVPVCSSLSAFTRDKKKKKKKIAQNSTASVWNKNMTLLLTVWNI